MKAVIVERPGAVVIRETAPPEPGPYDALVHMQGGCLCNSTDRKLVRIANEYLAELEPYGSPTPRRKHDN